MNSTGILIVDDSHFMRNLLGNTIKEIGYSGVHYAEDGIQAVSMAKDLLPGLVTLDISMPGIDGIETVSKILEVSPKTKIVMVSAINSQNLIKEAIKNGAVDFIKKPVDKTELSDILRKHLG